VNLRLVIIIIILPTRPMAYPGFYLVSVGKPFGEKPTSPASYDCLRASTGFCVNSQRMSISEAPIEIGGGDLSHVGMSLLLLPLEALRASSDSLGFLRLGTACSDAFGTADSEG
jgi:hypothetical protein